MLYNFVKYFIPNLKFVILHVNCKNTRYVNGFSLDLNFFLESFKFQVVFANFFNSRLNGTVYNKPDIIVKAIFWTFDKVV